MPRSVTVLRTKQISVRSRGVLSGAAERGKGRDRMCRRQSRQGNEVTVGRQQRPTWCTTPPRNCGNSEELARIGPTRNTLCWRLQRHVSSQTLFSSQVETAAPWSGLADLAQSRELQPRRHGCALAYEPQASLHVGALWLRLTTSPCTIVRLLGKPLPSHW